MRVCVCAWGGIGLSSKVGAITLSSLIKTSPTHPTPPHPPVTCLAARTTMTGRPLTSGRVCRYALPVAASRATSVH